MGRGLADGPGVRYEVRKDNRITGRGCGCAPAGRLIKLNSGSLTIRARTGFDVVVTLRLRAEHPRALVNHYVEPNS